ncbi:related to nicotianamine synthase [Rhynchosporium graminicola]|uniref:Related to nicotianamine synthase n=1 Tax=Rhynchosporium graminicola TaxID=2792576 RepID=A0A1E1KNM9_9HELO|nr:related to nicotianamine synthase [Rhynchosporium commune]
MAFIISNFLAACKFKPESEFKSQLVPASLPATTFMTTKRSPSDEEAEIMISRLLEIHGRLEAIGSDHLKPCDEVNLLFGGLVDLCIKTVTETVTNKVLNDTRIVAILPSLHQLCAIAECHMESYWAKKVSNPTFSSDPSPPAHSSTMIAQANDRLSSFPYCQNYTDLTRMELSALSSLITPNSPPLQKFAFIGSGPLPLTSLCIYQTAASFILPSQTHSFKLSGSKEETAPIEVLNIDINPKAIAESKRLCESLGPGADGMSFLCSPADSPSLDLSNFDVVYLAALVGSTQTDKEALLESVVGRMREGAFLVVRSAERLRRLLYPEFNPTTEKISSCLEICLAVHPYNNVVNSVIIGRVRGRTEK